MRTSLHRHGSTVALLHATDVAVPALSHAYSILQLVSHLTSLTLLTHSAVEAEYGALLAFLGGRVVDLPDLAAEVGRKRAVLTGVGY